MATERTAKRREIIDTECPECGARIIIDGKTKEVAAYPSRAPAAAPRPAPRNVGDPPSPAPAPGGDPAPDPAPDADDEQDSFLAGW